MEYFPAPLEKLVEQFARLPGIGGKSAQRLAFYVLGLPMEEAQEFADAIVGAKKNVTCCPVCRNFTAGGLCPICASPKRDQSLICVVADAQMGQRPPAVKFRQTGQQVTFFLALTMASANSCASSTGRPST